MNTAAVILARAGSKGVPGKNTAMVGGRPCVAWTIDAAKAARTVDVAALSTDDSWAADAGRAAGIAVIDRPAALASDGARADDAARHAVEQMERAAGGRCARVVILYGNVPVRPEGLIDRAVRLMMETGCDSVQSYAPVGKHHPWWTARVERDGRVRPWEGDVLNHGVFRRQDLPAAHVPDGGVLVVSRRALFGDLSGEGAGAEPGGPHAFLGVDRRGVITEEGAVVDIDTRIDLLVADALLRERGAAGGRA